MKKMKKLLAVLSLVGLLLAVSGPAIAEEMWGTGSPDWGIGTSGPGPVIFKFDTSNGAINTTFSFDSYNWMWISGIADNGKYLYASHNTYNTDSSSYMDTHDSKIAKIDRTTGAVLSDTSIAGSLGQTFSQVNALDFKDGNLYAVENATSGSSIRGYAMQVLLDANGNVIGANQGAFVGPYPDCGLDFHNELWYATSWGYTSEVPKKQGSIVYTSPDIMNTPFTQVGTGYSAVKGIGMIDGWEFDKAGSLLAVSWYDPSDWIATGVYRIDTNNWTATNLYDLASQLLPTITSLDGLSEVSPTYYSCSGFEPPANSGAIKVKKNRVIPLKTQLFDVAGSPVTNLSSPPAIQVWYQLGTVDADDVSNEALSAGQGTEGNQFIFSDGKWQFNLQTKNYSAKGTYTIQMVPGDTGYIIDSSPTATFVIE